MTLERIGLDPSKAVFTLHGVGQDETAVLRRSMRRAAMEAFFARLPPTLVAPEACGGPHRWGRRRAGLGRTVQLIPPHHVKPFVKRGKNDRNDAGAISEAAARPAEQQAEAVVLSARAPLVRQRTPLVNAVRGHAAAFGIVAAKNISRLPALLEVVAAEATVPIAAKQMLAFLGAGRSSSTRPARSAGCWPRCPASARSAQ